MNGHLPIIAAAVCVWFVAGCDNTIDPLVDGSEDQFSIYGYLDSAADTQFVRLDGVRASAVTRRESLADVRVTSSDAQGGSLEWKHRTLDLADGTDGDGFFAVFRPQPGIRYSLQAESPSGEVTTASVTVPRVPTLQLLPPSGDTLTLMQNVRVLGLESDPLRLTVVYEVRPPESGAPVKVGVNYGTGGGARGGRVQFDVFLTRDQATVLTSLNRDVRDRDVGLVSIGLRTEVLSSEWDHPDAAPNISSGRGFFGAIGRYDIAWSLEPEVVRTMGFVDEQ